GTASGPHTGDLPLSQMVDSNSMATDVFISVAAGNEGNARLHYKGAGEKSIVEFNVGMEEEILVMELWGQAPDIYSISFETPDGVTVERIPPRFNGSERIQFAIGSTVLQVSYTLVEAQSGNELIYIWMYKPLPGVWKLHVRGEGRVTQFFNIWMQLSQYVRPDTYFLEPMPDITLTSPGDNENATTVTEYDHRTNSISLGASRGFTADDRIKPDLAAPGVNILGMGRRGYYERRSGTSISAAHVAGAACLMQQWSKDNLASPLTGIQIRRYLIGGAKRADNISWPSKLWGWGQLDLLEVFDSLRRNV
ncbi:MAG: S8 family serine peptidase, partial [Lachnospiraceae bacterium]|nr:S8 family serine peptidase [Lachnospiraceae bacterium]